eukprot:CAMPEP_0197034762 /NCGR_PEP_ID=MMETSP1384-20130603/12752_1 /TAXON_ID=29189 /ORGANISM="Ammonia sp." /LENGTH=222 /DNA_ID=CAMNT_0042464717 /DNA_START=28 /DNA_END=696 /DNA_ORIENTATION=-
MALQDWQRDFEELRRKLDSAKNDIDKMIGYERDGVREQYMACKRAARKKLKDVATNYPPLKKQLHSLQGLTDNELRRRAKELKSLEREYTETKAKLENKHNERGGSGRQNIVESHETMNLENEQIKQLQFQKRQEQDEDLDEILKGVKRVNNITYDIHTELERQDVIIDDIGDAMDNANRKVSTNVKRVEFLNKKSKDKGCCCLMTILFLCIIALLIWNLAG